MTRIIFILFFPVLGWSQNTNFTKEQIEFVDKFFEKYGEYEITSTDYFLSELDIAMKKVPYHPAFVQSLLRTRLFRLAEPESEFVYEYCKKLDNHYLSTFQSVLVDPCAFVYYYIDDVDGLYERIIPLIKDINIKDLYQAAYYFEKRNEDEFLKYSKYSLLKNYKYESLNYLRDRHLVFYYAFIANKKDIKLIRKFFKDYETIIFSANLDSFVYAEFLENAIYILDFEMAQRLIDHVKQIDAEKFEYIYPLIALYHSYKGEEDLAVEALNKAFEIDKSGFLNFYRSELNLFRRVIFDVFCNSILGIHDDETKRRLVEKGIQYFDGIDEYKIRFMLYQSILYSSKDLEAAKDILKKCKLNLNEFNFNDLSDILIIQNELGKKKPNYRMIDGLLNNVVSRLNINSFYFQKIMYRYKVNYNSKKSVFTLNEIVEGFDKILGSQLDPANRLMYLTQRLAIIGESDKEWLARELELLPEDLADELIENFDIEENTPEKVAEILSTNQKELEDINGTVDFITVKYLNSIILKE